DRSWNSQTGWMFQDELPTLVSRFTLQLPTGWRASAITFNHTPVEPTVAGTNYTWELRNLAPVAAEPASPAWTNIVPRLAVSYFPPDGAQVAGVRPFANWTDVSRWVSELADPQADANDALATKAMQLTQGAKTELEKIQAIGRFVQGIQYISIDISVGHGGGIRPHAATEVFAKSYGDCKDKANLMRAMLKVVGIPAYLVAIYSGDPNYVREEWASPGQFNHCIIAVKVSDETQAATVINHPKLGRLLIFDATDDDTPVGDLPDHEQGSLALVVAGADGALLRMPTTPPEANQLERQTEVSLAADGSISASVHERARGQSAAGARGEFKHFSRPEYQRIIQA
ncbi:MAG TPA: transglutaminase family protein, partial [Pyrinomonadaceae bacterium]|nr:transglutaminase family protein [Pyrinomonadaceae bacterium]